MYFRSLILGSLVLVLSLCQARAQESGLPRELDSAPCRSAPTIDGVIHAEEWRDAPVHSFALNFVRLDPLANKTRPCELRVMNSANGLYLALKVPDTTLDETLEPLKLDAAILAFGRGDKVEPHDDRKFVAHGLYRDKVVVGAGKDDADDPHQDGRGAMTRADGVCSFEWALPLDGDDTNDLRAKPGDALRFNILYADGFQAPITKAFLGGLYGPHLDNAKAWGTLKLAANVEPDDGTAFQGPGWIKTMARDLARLAPGLRVNGEGLASGDGAPAARLPITFTYLDEHGVEKESLAKLFVPGPPPADPTVRRPLFFYAGYELPEGAERPYLDRGWIVASSRDLPANPLIRTANPDAAWLHLVRSLPWVDDSRVVIGGGSAGGWMTLRLAAETFPLAGAVPDLPPVNWGYNGAFLFSQLEKIGPLKPNGPARVASTYGVGMLLKGSLDVYGPDYDDATWFAASPVAHVSTITAPVSVCWSTADILVPVNQIGQKWVQPFDPAQFPPGYAMDPKALVQGPNARLTLLDALPETEFEVFTIPVPPGTARHGGPAGSGVANSFEMPISDNRRWSIAIIDEGPPEPTCDHQKYHLTPTRETFLKQVMSQPISPDQLNEAKLRRLMSRYAGQEWLPSRLKTLDRPEAERADVLRGLRTYLATSPAHAHRFTELYETLPKADQALDVETLKTLLNPRR